MPRAKATPTPALLNDAPRGDQQFVDAFRHRPPNQRSPSDFGRFCALLGLSGNPDDYAGRAETYVFTGGAAHRAFVRGFKAGYARGRRSNLGPGAIQDTPYQPG